MQDRSYQMQALRALFTKEDCDKIVGRGAFPLTPLSSCLLLRLSEKIAQNERTLFTFLTGKDLYSLATFVERSMSVDFAGAPLIYDYFSQLLEGEAEQAVHREWLNAEHALEKTEDKDAKRILKAIAVIRMINQPDEFPATEDLLHLATGIEPEHCKHFIKALCEQKVIRHKENSHTYDFCDSIGIDLQESVNDCVKKHFTSVRVPDILNQINCQKYILPKKYNQDHCMTRYFQVHMMYADSFMALSSVAYLPKENDPDGYMLLILNDHKETVSDLRRHLEELSDPTVMAAILEPIPQAKEKVQKLQAIGKLLSDQVFLTENKAASVELEAWKNNLMEELNGSITDAMEHLTALYTQTGMEKMEEGRLNRAVSEVAEAVYNKTPIINHESINRHNVTAQYSKARNSLLDDIFHSREFDRYNTGTSAESTIYRACLGATKEDANLLLVRREITDFIHESKGKKNTFASLVNKLTKPPYGMRRGVLPFYIAEQIMQLEDMPVIYHDKTEIALSPKLIVDAINAPENHYLYVETDTVEKLEYIEGLEKLFSEYGSYCREIESMNRLARLKCFIQAWYRSLPQAATTFQEKDYPNQDMRKLKLFRKALTGEPNPRELIFEQIPRIFEADALLDTLKAVKEAKKDLDTHTKKLKKQAEQIVRLSLGLPKEDDFLQSLREWYENVPEKAKNSILPSASQDLLNCIRGIAENNEGELIEKIAKASTNFFVEDWNEKIIREFETTLKEFVSDLQQKEETVGPQSKKISISTGDRTKECFYDFDPEALSAPGMFFQCALDDMMDEYGALDNSEKIGILMNLVNKLMG